jgi:HK97 family phage major capsid protein
MNPLELLQKQLEEITLHNEQILQLADSEGRGFSADEQRQIDDNASEFDRISVEIQMRQRIATQRSTLGTSQGRTVDPQATTNNRTGIVPNRDREAANTGREPMQRGRVFANPRDRTADQRGGFPNMGEFFQAVRMASLPGRGQFDQRLNVWQDTTTTFANETAGTDGGFLVPTDFRTALISRIMGEDSLLGRCDQIQTQSTSVTMPVDVDEVWNDNSGVFARWENEGGVKPESKINLDQMNIRLNKLVCLIPVSDELLEDAPAVDGYIRRKAPDKINFKVSQALLDGDGQGKPLGILKSGAKVTVPAGAAPSGSLQFAHVAQMWGRMYGPWRNNAVWLVSPEAEAALMTMFFSTAPVATVPATPIPVYLPANSISGSPYATLLGRPVIPTQACQPLGTEGDIIFADFSQYLALIRTGGIKTDVSIHVYFVQDLTAFRFVLRIGGMPWLPSPLTPRVGTFTQSAFVTLQSR